MATATGQPETSPTPESTTPWVLALNTLKKLDPAWAEHCLKVTTGPWTSKILPAKFLELIMVALNASHTQINPDGARRHIRAALAAGASQQEILFVLKVACVMSLHSSSFNAPMLLQEASVGSLEDFGAMRKKRLKEGGEDTPAVKQMKAIGHWSDEWDSILFFDPVWTNEYMKMCTELYSSRVLSPKELELLLIAFDASRGQDSSPFTRRHIKSAFKAGATVDEIMEVLKLGVVQGMQSCNISVTILGEELDRLGV